MNNMLVINSSGNSALSSTTISSIRRKCRVNINALSMCYQILIFKALIYFVFFFNIKSYNIILLSADCLVKGQVSVE